MSKFTDAKGDVWNIHITLETTRRLATVVGIDVFNPNDYQRLLNSIGVRLEFVYYVCKACKDAGQTLKPYETPFPLDCPKCDQPKAVEGFRCVGCKRVIENQPKVQVFFCPHDDCRFKYNRRALGG